MRFKLDAHPESKAKLKVVGVGGAGGNAVNRMVESGFTGVDFVAINTDMQALEQSVAPRRIQIGADLTKGLGSGGDPEIGRQAILENQEVVAEALSGSDMIFIAGGMGGGTGTGAAPIIADLAKQTGALVVGVVTKPFAFEGQRRTRLAEEGLAELKAAADTAIVIPNQRLLAVAAKDMPVREAFKIADDVLLRATRGVTDLITVPGLVNLDFADVRSIMAETGDALMGTGASRGENRAVEAAQQALSSPLLEDVGIIGAKGVLVNVTGGSSLTLHEINEAATVINDAIGSETNMMFGAVIDESMEDEIAITVIATGIGGPRPTEVVKRERRQERPVTSEPSQVLQTPSRIMQENAYVAPPRAADPDDGGHFRRPIEHREPDPDRKRHSEPAGMYASSRRKVRPSSKGDLSVPAFIRKQMD